METPSRASRLAQTQTLGNTVWRSAEYVKFAASSLKNPGEKRLVIHQKTQLLQLLQEARHGPICSPARLQLCPYSSFATFPHPPTAWLG